MYADNELLFPAHVISSLRNSRGEEWCALVERVSSLPETNTDFLAHGFIYI